jgi:deazaflavin-dependent oxidoreductase (nitroreductase family)
LRYRLARIALTESASRVTSRVLPPLDRLTLRLTKGKHTLLGILSGFPIITMTTTGAKSGQKRSVFLVAIPRRDSLIVVASNHGKPAYPAWYHNLRTHPVACVTRDNQTYEVTARESHGEDRTRLWEACIERFPGWVTYDRRTHRHLPIMVLTPVESY